ncbi:MarR family winged helix-turn-helix transcriptional regulator [uncultured Ruegeria sp.]|uniref:MarR family winged helix-turn-helix transcriptional regulator n=1 Tax=uncultured Ruegeria sp. TaxID=259304 RepID=UPI00261EA7D5|nr:MarR family transcriptional regulator [uncultured Ruegeria sp.]
MTHEKQGKPAEDFISLFETIGFPEAYRITYLAGSIAGPAYDAIKSDFGIIRAEFVLLACLAHFDEMKAQDIADISRRPRNTVSRAVHRMVAEGYIERSPDAEDGRQALLRITPAGRALQDKAAQYLKTRQDRVLAALSADDRKAFSDILLKLAVNATKLDDE